MFNSKMIGTNGLGLPPQPEGTGAFLMSSAQGLYISVDDGVTWTNNAFTGIDPTNDFSHKIGWNGVNFVTFSNGNIYISPDGYNWTLSASFSGYTNMRTCFYNVDSNEFIIGLDTYGVKYGVWSSYDGGVTWTNLFEETNTTNGNYLSGVISWYSDNRGVAVTDRGSWVRAANSSTWNFTAIFSNPDYGLPFGINYRPLDGQNDTPFGIESGNRVTGRLSVQHFYYNFDARPFHQWPHDILTSDTYNSHGNVVPWGSNGAMIAIRKRNDPATQFRLARITGLNTPSATNLTYWYNIIGPTAIGKHNDYYFFRDGANFYKTLDIQNRIYIGPTPSQSISCFASKSFYYNS